MKDGGFVDYSEIGINVIFAVIPSILLCLYVYEKDVVEKEPIMMLIRLFFLGILVTVPTYFTERFVMAAFKIEETNYLNCFIIAFCIVALIEETFKYIIFYFGSWRNKNFDHKYDAIVYAVFVSLGFATLENILYVNSYERNVALLGAIISVPAHAFFGIASGFFVGLAKKFDLAKNNSKRIQFTMLGLAIPVLLHGIFDFLLMTGNETLLGVFYSFVAILYFVSFMSIKKVSGGEMLVKKLRINKALPVPETGVVQEVNNTVLDFPSNHQVADDKVIVSADRPVIKDFYPHEEPKTEPPTEVQKIENNEKDNLQDISVESNINITAENPVNAFGIQKEESANNMQVMDIPKQEVLNPILEATQAPVMDIPQVFNPVPEQTQAPVVDVPKQSFINEPLNNTQSTINQDTFNPANFLAPSNTGVVQNNNSKFF